MCEIEYMCPAAWTDEAEECPGPQEN